MGKMDLEVADLQESSLTYVTLVGGLFLLLMNGHVAFQKNLGGKFLVTRLAIMTLLSMGPHVRFQQSFRRIPLLTKPTLKHFGRAVSFQVKFHFRRSSEHFFAHRTLVFELDRVGALVAFVIARLIERHLAQVALVLHFRGVNDHVSLDVNLL